MPKLPKFLIGDSADERTFVIHLHTPRLIMEVVEEYGVGVKLEPVEWFDDEESFIATERANEREPASSLATLLRQAGEFYLRETERE